MSKLEYLYMPMAGDRERILENLEKLKLQTKEELVDAVNRQIKVGVVRVRAQLIYLIALRMEMLKRLGWSPIYVKDDCIIGIEYSDEVK